MAFDPQPWRADTAAALGGRVHLNNAGAALMPQPVVAAIRDHIAREVQYGGYEAEDAAASQIGAVYDAVASLTAASARNIAIVENATVAIDLALSSFEFEPGDVLLTTRNDYVSSQLAYLSLARRFGVDVVRAADLPEGGVDPESVRELIAERRPKVVALTWVPTSSGLVQDAAAVGVICREAGVPYIVDACQAVGQIPIDAPSLHCDFLAATARKFLRGPRGVGFLYVSDDALTAQRMPMFPDMRGATWTSAGEYTPAPDAKRFENWEFAYALVLGLGEAARYAGRVGVAEGGAYAAELAAYAREQLSNLPGARVLDRGRALCAIATVHFPGHSSQALVEALREEAINTSATTRSSAVLDFDDKGVTDALRISPHYYNTRREVDLVVGALEVLTG